MWEYRVAENSEIHFNMRIGSGRGPLPHLGMASLHTVSPSQIVLLLLNLYRKLDSGDHDTRPLSTAAG